MNKKKVLAIFIALAMILPAVVGVSQGKASYPSFTISEVKTDQTVTILTKDIPKNLDFKVLMGEYDTRGENGIESAIFNSGEGGSFAVTIDIPPALKGRAMISIRIESTTGGYYYYNWFWNNQANGTWPVVSPTAPPATGTPAPTGTPSPAVPVPTFKIKSVVAGESVTIVASDFPKSREFKVLMGKMWTRGINGIETALITSSETGAFEATFPIPAELADHERIAIRLESVTGGYFSYNWFWNKTGSGVVAPEPTVSPAPTGTPAPQVKYPYMTITGVVKDSTVTFVAEQLPKDVEFKVLMGKMWTQAINGTEAGVFNSGEGGQFTGTFDIPASLYGQPRIAIRIQGGGLYAYNWFWNSTATIPY